ncbi:MAG TPA: YusW family protein [Paenisporosarcina sp.]|nr:YusW family protein [Paenisporosarcina sp.]
MTFKKTKVIASLILSTALLGACGDKDEITKDVTNNNTSNDIEDVAPGEDPADTGESYGFKKFELEVDYPDQEEAIDVNYEEKKDSTDAEYRNVDDENADVTGHDAMAKLRIFLGNLKLKEDMSDEEIINQIVETFDIKKDHTKIAVDITWLNDKKKEIELIK